MAKSVCFNGNSDMATGVTSLGHQQRLLVMPDDGEQAVLDLLGSAKTSLRI